MRQKISAALAFAALVSVSSPRQTQAFSPDDELYWTGASTSAVWTRLDNWARTIDQGVPSILPGANTRLFLDERVSANAPVGGPYGALLVSIRWDRVVMASQLTARGRMYSLQGGGILSLAGPLVVENGSDLIIDQGTTVDLTAGGDGGNVHVRDFGMYTGLLLQSGSLKANNISLEIPSDRYNLYGGLAALNGSTASARTIAIGTNSVLDLSSLARVDVSESIEVAGVAKAWIAEVHAPAVHVATTGSLHGQRNSWNAAWDPGFGGYYANIINDGQVSPGDTEDTYYWQYRVGALPIHGNYTQSETGLLRMHFFDQDPWDTGSHDRLEVDGDVQLDGQLELVFSPDFAPAVDGRYTIVDVGGTLTGEFAGLPEGALAGIEPVSGRSLYVTYHGGDGNDVVVYVPEPLSLSFPALAALLLLRHRVRARR